MATSRYCDGIKRRDFLKVGALGMGGLSLASYLRMAAAGQVDPHSRAKAGILVNLQGGPSHMDTFDLKPEAPEEYRGEFKPIDTNAPGVQISEHLPRLAKAADKFAVVRGVSHTLAAHALGQQYVNTGNRPLPSLVFPGYASVVMKETPEEGDIPSAVAIPQPPHPAGYLGVSYTPLATGATPRKGQPFRVRGMTVSGSITVTDLEKRQHLLGDLDTLFRGYEAEAEIVAGLDRFAEQAQRIISSKRAREAFDISREPAAIAEPFGESAFGQSCLLAVRLIEAGVRFVSINFGGWDTHADNFNRLKGNQLPQLDAGLASLFGELDRRGLHESTSVLTLGEFGRTPKVNARGGRDHYPRAMFAVMGGGGIRGGQVVGASDEKGTGPAGDPISPDSIAASFYHSLGINHQQEYHTSTGRPVMIVRNGEVIRQLFG